jgi:formate-dependent nitrite reductase membrane component NrfD
MLRVFKLRSAMSVGAWTLMVFSAAAIASLAGHTAQLSGDSAFVRHLADAAGVVSAASGLILATYTGVLIGVTAIPVWAANVRVLPVLFGLSGLGAAVSLLELIGDRQTSLNTIGIGVAIVESALLFWFERRGDPRSAALHNGTAATLTRSAGALSGPVALAARLLSLSSLGGVPVRLVASVAMVLGSLLTRFGWIAAGRASAADVSISLR